MEKNSGVYLLNYVYIGKWTALDGADSPSFANDFARNVGIFCVDNSSSSHTENCKNNFLVSEEGLTNNMNCSDSAVE